MSNSNAETIKNIADEAIDIAEEKTFESMESARQAATAAADKMGTLEEDISESVTAVTKTVTRYINEKPVHAAGIAFAAGVLTTLLLSRR